MKNVVILGSTGSIGVQTLNIIRRYPDTFRVAGLVANSNADLLYEQAKEFRPAFTGLADKRAADIAVKKFGGGFLTQSGPSALTDAASLSGADTVMSAVVGICGLEAVWEAVKRKKKVLLANKESLVAGGEIVMALKKQTGSEILPVDSEHSAVWQCMAFSPKSVKRIILTASGGSFWGKSREELKTITADAATKHPNWAMGKKITVDCSTMMNKGLEMIEARWLFDTLNIDYIIHRESIIHGMAEFIDGTIAAAMSNPSMEYPISLALSYPERFGTESKKYNFEKNLTFLQPDEQTFPLPRLAKESMLKGGTAPCVLNSANEAAVGLFLKEKIGFLDIERIVKDTMGKASYEKASSVQQIIDTHNYWYNKILNDNGAAK